jgi:integrase
MGDLEQGDGAKVEARAVVIPNQAQIKKLFAEAEKQGYREFVELGFYGLRKGEILGLTWADFDGKSFGSEVTFCDVPRWSWK